MVVALGTGLAMYSFAATRTLTFNGKLTPSQPTASYQVVSETTGTLTAETTFNGSLKRATVQLLDTTGNVLRTTSGSSPLSINSPVIAGNYTVRISSQNRGNYSISVTYPTKDIGDNTSPSVPGGVTTSVDTNNVNIRWTASTDNIGVNGYYIIRDGAKIGSVSGTTLGYTDLAVLNGTYSYSVQAYDAANNLSLQSPNVSTSVNYTPVPPPTGQPTTSAKGSFVERACTRSYNLSGMQVGPTGDPVFNGDRFRSVLNAAIAGDCILVDPGQYRLAGNINFDRAGITLKGLGATREEVFFDHTTETRAIFMVRAGDVHFYNFTHRVYASARSSLGQSGEGNIWAQGGHSGFRMQDILAWGSRDAAIFTYGINNFVIYDSVSRNSGDDGIGIVGYGAEGPGTSHHMTIVRHSVFGQSHGRGFGFIHINNIKVHGPTLIESSAAAAVIFAREPGYGSGNVKSIHIMGELRLRQSNLKSTIDHGAILINNPDTVGVIEDIIITGPVLIKDTRVSASDQIRVFGAGKIQAQIDNVRFYGTGPNSLLYKNLAAGSSLATNGWSSTDPYLTTEPQFPLPL
jgi:hypothetical protein